MPTVARALVRYPSHPLPVQGFGPKGKCPSVVTGPNSVPTDSPTWGVVKKETNANSPIMVQHSCRIPWLWSGSKGLQLIVEQHGCGTARLPNSTWRIASIARHLCSVPHLSGAVPATLLLSALLHSHLLCSSPSRRHPCFRFSWGHTVFRLPCNGKLCTPSLPEES